MGVVGGEKCFGVNVFNVREVRIVRRGGDLGGGVRMFGLWEGKKKKSNWVVE